MTISIHVDVPQDMIQNGAGDRYLDRALGVIGFARTANATYAAPPAPATAEEKTAEFTAALGAPASDNTPEETAPAGDSGRVYARPEEGRARRTKDQIAEDKAIDAAWTGEKDFIPTNISASALLVALQKGEYLQAPETAPLGISSGENRIDPTNPDDAAQDAADEAAESGAVAGEALTHDDLRRVVGEMQTKMGMEALVEVVPKILGCGLAEVKVEDLGARIAELRDLMDADTAPADPVGTSDGVLAAMLDYAEKFDGTRAPDENSFTAQDATRILQSALGEGVVRVSAIPNDPKAYGKAETALRSAIEANPYGRTPK